MWIVRFCKTHPTYGLKRQPRGTCKACWRAWRLKEGMHRAMASVVRNVDRLYGPDSIYVAVNWTGGKGDVKGVRLESLPIRREPSPRSHVSSVPEKKKKNTESMRAWTGGASSTYGIYRVNGQK